LEPLAMAKTPCASSNLGLLWLRQQARALKGVVIASGVFRQSNACYKGWMHE